MIFNLKKLCYNIGKEATVKQEESFGGKSMERIGIAGNILKALFKNVYFINGTAYAGKSTMVKLLSEK